MDVTINILWVGGSVILSMIIGYFLGRNEHRGLPVEEESEETVEGQYRVQKANVHLAAKYHKNEGCCIPQGKPIVSPVAGEVHFFCEGGRRGAVIEPEQGMVYAPMSGKITKLFPMGNAFILRSNELGCPKELLIQVGRQHPDELCSMYYRARIVQNEIVNKGKLLLTFDMERLQEAGEELGVTVSLEDALIAGEVTVTQKERVKVGDELLWVK